MLLYAQGSDLVNTREITSRNLGSKYMAKVDFAHLLRASAPPVRAYKCKVLHFKTGSYNSGLEGTVESLMALHQKQNLKSLLNSLILKENQETDVDSLTITAETVLDAIGEFGPAIVKLDNLIPDRVQGEHLATVLRTSYSWRSQIYGWNEALEVAKAALINEGIDPADALYGMV